MKGLLRSNVVFFVFLLTLFGAFFRFYHLNWGAPYYFHPDERNIASSVSQLVFPGQMNPNFFAYGSLPIYVIFFTGLLGNLLAFSVCHLPFARFLPLHNCFSSFTGFQIGFAQAIVISRFYSALFSTLLIPLLYLIGKTLKDERVGLFASFLGFTSVGFIQFAHFGTFEMWLSLWSVLLFYFCLRLLGGYKKSYLFWLAVIFGGAIATKVSHLALLPLLLLALFWGHIRHYPQKRLIAKVFPFIRDVLGFLGLSLLIYFLTNPFVILDFPSFINSMHYESGVALGTMRVFYTGEFLGTMPVGFQLLHVYPFLMTPLLTSLFLASFLAAVFLCYKTRRMAYSFLLLFFLVLFASQAFFYVKWTRYMVPTLPFIYLLLGLVFSYSFIRRFIFVQVLWVLTVLLTVITSISYFVTVFVERDTRVSAAAWAQKNIPADASILSEVYDLGITPFNDSFHSITLFNFYDLDNNSPVSDQAHLVANLTNSEYIILPSQRLLKIRIQNGKDFPVGHTFYSSLLNGRLGYKKVYETSCDIFCLITYFGSPIYRYEETVSVFDRPEVMIFEKI